jgi:hypothetical protein
MGLKYRITLSNTLLAVIADYDAESAVEREMVLRLASILWRLRRATGIETALFSFAANETTEQGDAEAVVVAGLLEHQPSAAESNQEDENLSDLHGGWPSDEAIANSYLRLIALPTFPLDRLTRYEHILWRQARQIVVTLEWLRRGRRTGAGFPFSFRGAPFDELK